MSGFENFQPEMPISKSTLHSRYGTALYTIPRNSRLIGPREIYSYHCCLCLVLNICRIGVLTTHNSNTKADVLNLLYFSDLITRPEGERIKRNL